MNFKTTLGLLIVLVVLGVVLLAVRNGSKPQPADSAAQEPKLVDLQSGDITKVALTGGDKPIVIERSEGNWRLVEPIKALADAINVESLINGVLNLRSAVSVDASGANAAAIGLDKPRYVVELTGKSGQLAKVKVGNRSPVGDRLYVQLEGKTQAAVVSGEIIEQLDKPFTSYRQTKLVNVSSNDIKQIQITRPDGKLTLQKSGENWEVTAPEKMPAETSEVNDISSAIAYLTAAEFADAAEVPPLLLPEKSPKTTIWFTTAAPTTQPAASQPAGTTIRFGGFDGVMRKNVYVDVSNPPTLAKVAATSIDAFNKKPLDLRDRKVLDVDGATVSKVSILTDTPATTQPTTKPASRSELVITRKKETVEVLANAAATKPTTGPATTQAATQPASTQPVLPPTSWTMKGPASGDASQFRVEGMLGKFHPLRADKYVASSAATTQPTAQYTVQIDFQAAGAAKSGSYQIRLTDPGQEKPLIGQCNGLTFELPRTLLESLTGDFANKIEPPPPPPMDMPPGRGMPPGMFGR